MRILSLNMKNASVRSWFSDHQFGSTAATTPHSRLTERKLCNGILIRTLTIGRLKPGVVELKDWQMSDSLNNNICQHSADFVYHMVTLRYCFVVHTIMTIMYGLIQSHWKTYSVWIYLHILMYTYTHLCVWCTCIHIVLLASTFYILGRADRTGCPVLFLTVTDLWRHIVGILPTK